MGSRARYVRGVRGQRAAQSEAVDPLLSALCSVSRQYNPTDYKTPLQIRDANWNITVSVVEDNKDLKTFFRISIRSEISCARRESVARIVHCKEQYRSKLATRSSRCEFEEKNWRKKKRRGMVRKRLPTPRKKKRRKSKTNETTIAPKKKD